MNDTAKIRWEWEVAIKLILDPDVKVETGSAFYRLTRRDTGPVVSGWAGADQLEDALHITLTPPSGKEPLKLRARMRQMTSEEAKRLRLSDDLTELGIAPSAFAGFYIPYGDISTSEETEAVIGAIKRRETEDFQRAKARFDEKLKSWASLYGVPPF